MRERAVFDKLDIVVKSAPAEDQQEARLRELLHALVPNFEHEDARTNPKVRRSYPSEEVAQSRVTF